MFLGTWSNVDDIIRDFGLYYGEPSYTARVDLDGAIILYARYSGYGHLGSDYEMWARVLYLKNDELYEVHGSHCSCYGLEGQWKPERVNPKDIVTDLKSSDTWGQNEDRAFIIAQMVKHFPQLFIA